MNGTIMSQTTEPQVTLSEFQPRAQLRVKQTAMHKPRVPVIDAHNHLGGRFGGGWDQRPVTELIDVLDEADVRVLVDLDGGFGETLLNAHLDHFKAAAPERFRIFGGVDWSAWSEQGDRFGEWAAERLRAQVARGAQGLKIWKPLGLQVRDQSNRLVSVDDERLDPLWQTAANLKLPVLIHVADPVAFFDPVDRFNERWEELHKVPDWQFPSPPFPSFRSIMMGLSNLVTRHAATTFIGAHVGCYAENLAWVSDLLERCPNFYVDISGRIPEIGRQPYTARRFFIRHADRILFGVDTPPDINSYRLYYRLLETDDEYFAYTADGSHPQGRWNIYGLFLPDDGLVKVYLLNAERVLLK